MHRSIFTDFQLIPDPAGMVMFLFCKTHFEKHVKPTGIV